jgi:hypothetical protein
MFYLVEQHSSNTQTYKKIFPISLYADEKLKCDQNIVVLLKDKVSRPFKIRKSMTVKLFTDPVRFRQFKNCVNGRMCRSRKLRILDGI